MENRAHRARNLCSPCRHLRLPFLSSSIFSSSSSQASISLSFNLAYSTSTLQQTSLERIIVITPVCSHSH